MWNAVALTPAEELVLKALKFLDRKIERIAAQASGAHYFGETRGGFIVKRAGSDQPVPIGSMGDGMWRMLAMAIAITQCRGGVLLVDEIDTGLHYSVMSQMWDLLYGAAQDLDVQVFATTHSYDCVYSLAQFCETKRSVTVQRIEPGKKRAVPYDEEEITVAASRDIEVR
jgi:predicted ATP-dependent endonuclease of OLD family